MRQYLNQYPFLLTILMHNVNDSDPAMIEKITKSLSLTIPSHILRSRDPHAILTTVMAAWLPLSTAVLVSVIEYLPSPPVAQVSRLPGLIDALPGSKYIDKAIRDAMIGSRANKSDPIVAYVSKMVSIPKSELPENKRRPGVAMSSEEARDMARRKRAEISKATTCFESSGSANDLSTAFANSQLCDRGDTDPRAVDEAQEPEDLIGFARLYSGTLSVGDSIYVLPPKFSQENPQSTPEVHKATVTGLYLMMGRGLEALQTVPAGAVFGIAGLEGHIHKSGTLCSQLDGAVNLAGVNLASQPIVRVALEPVNPGDLGKMIEGMKILEQSDPCAQYEVLESGEHVISTAGELHLERCLKDLRERFARCEIQAGEPIVPYRESIISALEMAPPRDKALPRGTVLGVTTSKQATVRLRVRPLPLAVTGFLEKNVRLIRRLYSEGKAEEGIESRASDEIGAIVTRNDADHHPETNNGLLSITEFKESLKSLLAEEKGQSEVWSDVVENIAAFGPRRIGPNLLIDSTENGTCHKL